MAKRNRTTVFLCIIIIILLVKMCFVFKDSSDSFLINVQQGETLEKSLSRTHLNGSQWIKLLSFVALDSVGKCEDLDPQPKTKQFEDVIKPYYDKVKLHDEQVNKIINESVNNRICGAGYSAEYLEETYVMISLARLPFVKTICETGFNEGHSALLWLSENTQAQVYSFDIGEFPCSKPMAKHLSSQYGDRFHVTWGDSTKTLPQFIEENPDVKCDLMVIDGGHFYEVARQDIINFRKIARVEDNIIFIDNHPDSRFKESRIGIAWEEAIRRGDIFEYFRCLYKDFQQGFTFGRFHFT